ncbi:hypothetical protein JX266_014228 [Neoarthrinium moseri]|nr:hypothetical protein JX266_014228 [Neoarthrinium moseri]
METDSHHPASALCSADASRLAAAVQELSKLKRYADEHEIQMRQLEDDIRLLSQIVMQGQVTQTSFSANAANKEQDLIASIGSWATGYLG